MTTVNGKQYVFSSKSPVMPILLWLIKNNRLSEVRSLLEPDRNYFYPEKADKNHMFDFMCNTDIKKDTRYTAAAIKQQNAEILKLLIDYGFSADILNQKKPDSACEDEFGSFGMISDYIYIDPVHPFVTEDKNLFEILLRSVKNINQIYSVCWNENGETYYNEMSLLCIALYFNKMDFADILVKKGARLEFNMYRNILDFILSYKNLWGSSFTTTGCISRDASYDDPPEMLHEWSPIGIILRKGDAKQIEWLINQTEHNPAAAHEVAGSVYYLQKNNFRLFMKKYPKYIRYLDWNSICCFVNEDAMMLYLQKSKPELEEKDALKLLSFGNLVFRPFRKLYDIVLSEKLYNCIKLLYRYRPDLFRSEDVQNQLYNIALLATYMDFKFKKGDTNAVSSKLLDFYNQISTSVPDATVFVKWYYGAGKSSEQYVMNSRDSAKLIKMFRITCKNVRPKINLSETFDSLEDLTLVSCSELASIMDTFQFYSAGEFPNNFYKLIIQTDSISLLKKLLAASSLNDKELEELTEYAIDKGAEKLIPILLLNKMKRQHQ